MALSTNCGHAIKPDQIAAFFGEIMIDKGRVQETNFDSYRIMRLKETPKIEAVIVPAVINAVFATGGGKLC